MAGPARLRRPGLAIKEGLIVLCKRDPLRPRGGRRDDGRNVGRVVQSRVTHRGRSHACPFSSMIIDAPWPSQCALAILASSVVMSAVADPAGLRTGRQDLGGRGDRWVETMKKRNACSRPAALTSWPALGSRASKTPQVGLGGDRRRVTRHELLGGTPAARPLVEPSNATLLVEVDPSLRFSELIDSLLWVALPGQPLKALCGQLSTSCERLALVLASSEIGRRLAGSACVPACQRRRRRSFLAPPRDEHRLSAKRPCVGWARPIAANYAERLSANLHPPISSSKARLAGPASACLHLPFLFTSCRKRMHSLCPST